MYTLIAFLAALTILIFVHELGHYLAARWFDVKVLRFSIGFGKPLLSWKVGKDQTVWSFNMIPLGGYVRMVDERDTETPISDEDLPRAFTRQSLAARSVVVAAGPVANFLLAIFLYATLGWIGVDEPSALIEQPAQSTPATRAGLNEGDRIVEIDGDVIRSWHDVRMALLEPVIEKKNVAIAIDRAGQRQLLNLDLSQLPDDEAERNFMATIGLDILPGRVEIGALLPDGAALASGLKPGDQVVSVDNTAIRRARDMITIIKASPNQAIRFDVVRDTTPLQIAVTPAAVTSDRGADKGQTIGRIGANLRDRLQMELVRHGPIEALLVGAEKTWQMSFFSLRMFGKMLTGQLSIRNLSGPVTIANLAGQTAKVGWFAYVSFLALISISLGVLNLLPIPVLDGGHLVYYGLEAIRGKPLSDRLMDFTQRAGVGVILVMMTLALFNDITRLFGS